MQAAHVQEGWRVALAGHSFLRSGSLSAVLGRKTILESAVSAHEREAGVEAYVYNAANRAGAHCAIFGERAFASENSPPDPKEKKTKKKRSRLELTAPPLPPDRVVPPTPAAGRAPARAPPCSPCSCCRTRCASPRGWRPDPGGGGHPPHPSRARRPALNTPAPPRTAPRAAGRRRRRVPRSRVPRSPARLAPRGQLRRCGKEGDDDPPSLRADEEGELHAPRDEWRLDARPPPVQTRREGGTQDAGVQPRTPATGRVRRVQRPGSGRVYRRGRWAGRGEQREGGGARAGGLRVTSLRSPSSRAPRRSSLWHGERSKGGLEQRGRPH